MTSDESGTDGSPVDDEPFEVSEKIAALDDLMAENTRRLAQLTARGQKLDQAHGGVDQLMTLEFLRAIVRAGWGEEALLDLDLHVQGKVGDFLDQVEPKAAEAYLLQPPGGVVPDGNRAARRHG